MGSSHLTAKELLNLGDQDRVKPVLNQYWPQVVGVSLGIATGVALNLTTRRPMFSGIQKHIAGVVGWTAALTLVQKQRLDYYEEKDAVLRHYIELHPEDFPDPERKKIADVFEPWVPIR